MNSRSGGYTAIKISARSAERARREDCLTPGQLL